MSSINENYNTDESTQRKEFDTGIEFADEYLNKSSGTEIKESSAEIYESSLRKYGRYLSRNDLEVLEISLDEFKEFLRFQVRQRLAQSTINIDLVASTNLYKFVRIETEFVAEIDLFGLNDINISNWNTRELPEPEPLTKDELKKLVAGTENRRDRLAIILAGETGARNESLRSIKLHHVDLELNSIELQNTKTGGTYDVPISDQVGLELERWIKIERDNYTNSNNSKYLFPSPSGEKFSSSWFHQTVGDAAKAAGIQEVIAEREPSMAEKNMGFESMRKRWRVSPHTLRRTFSDLLKKAELDTEARRDALDHQNTEVTEEYYTFDNSGYTDMIRRLFHNSDYSFHD